MHAETPAGLADQLRARGTDTVRILWSDLHGIARGKDVVVDDIDRVVRGGINFCQAVMITDLRANAVLAAETDGSGWPDAVALPDVTTLRHPAYDPGVAIMLADLAESESTATGGHPGPLSFSPRQVLREQVAALAVMDLEPVMAPELEFYVCRPALDDPQRWEPYVGRDTAGYVVGVEHDPLGVLNTLMREGSALELGLIAGNHEFSGGQFEINHAHSSALDAADRGFLFKHMVKEVASQRGLRATFMGKPFNGLAGSGMHVHVSLNDSSGRNAFAGEDEHLSALARHFLGGVLAHAPALSAILNPSVNAFKRLAAGADGLTPTRPCWGFDNRTAYARIPPEGGAGSRLEVRVGDALANPYLAFAAILAAGRDGIERGLDPGEPLQPGHPSVTEPLPRSLGGALDALSADRQLAKLLGEDLVSAFVRLKAQELARYEATVTDWEFGEYSWLL